MNSEISSVMRTCLSRTRPKMCKSCIFYCKDMINRQFNKVITTLTDKDGVFDVDRAFQFEVRFLKELGVRIKSHGISNVWRSDKKLHSYIHQRITLEVEMKKKKEQDEDVETVSSIPDKGR